MSDTHPIAVDDESPASQTPITRALFGKLASFHDAKRSAEVAELQTVHELCLAFKTVDEDAYGEAAEQLTYRGALLRSPSSSASKSAPCSASRVEPPPA